MLSQLTAAGDVTPEQFISKFRFSLISVESHILGICDVHVPYDISFCKQSSIVQLCLDAVPEVACALTNYREL